MSFEVDHLVGMDLVAALAAAESSERDRLMQGLIWIE